MTTFKTIFVSEVRLDTAEAVLIDTRGVSYKVKLETTSMKKQFKQWFKGKFLKCIPQTVTLLKLDDKGEITTVM